MTTQEQPILINNFDDFDGPNPHRFLSNFYVGEPLDVFGETWRTGEHAFAGMKAWDPKQRKAIKDAKTPGQAKALGRKCKLRSDWEEVKYDVMAAIVRAKFRLDRDEGPLLVFTGDAFLVEGTWWNDKVWGTNHGGFFPAAQGRNWLGTLLMARRAELVAMRAGAPDYNTGDHNAAWSRYEA